jgi:hypothetical protein
LNFIEPVPAPSWFHQSERKALAKVEGKEDEVPGRQTIIRIIISWEIKKVW